jgi:hypothetical protein
MNDGSVNSESNSKVSINESNINDGSNSDHNEITQTRQSTFQISIKQILNKNFDIFFCSINFDNPPIWLQIAIYDRFKFNTF